ncbi:YokU family protein [Bacillus atrophaeus]|uniref:YokU family protein n=1 Tax=Bacillus atrophaeus TaxID=1452 RepID=UPI002E1CAA49|nr:YokU family protein [Bacillus atrophaeus]MED4861507.1 YokU family protein [Bacillus atrophaeus]
MKTCEWCDGLQVSPCVTAVYWELPDGTKAIEITETPALSCADCDMVYQEELTIKEIEDQLILIDTKKLPHTITFQQLMQTERILKRNYFDFS